MPSEAPVPRRRGTHVFVGVADALDDGVRDIEVGRDPVRVNEGLDARSPVGDLREVVPLEGCLVVPDRREPPEGAYATSLSLGARGGGSLSR